MTLSCAIARIDMRLTNRKSVMLANARQHYLQQLASTDAFHKNLKQSKNLLGKPDQKIPKHNQQMYASNVCDFQSIDRNEQTDSTIPNISAHARSNDIQESPKNASEVYNIGREDQAFFPIGTLSAQASGTPKLPSRSASRSSILSSQTTLHLERNQSQPLQMNYSLSQKQSRQFQTSENKTIRDNLGLCRKSSSKTLPDLPHIATNQSPMDALDVALQQISSNDRRSVKNRQERLNQNLEYKTGSKLLKPPSHPYAGDILI